MEDGVQLAEAVAIGALTVASDPVALAIQGPRAVQRRLSTQRNTHGKKIAMPLDASNGTKTP